MNIKELKQKYKQLNIAEKLIVINVICFVFYTGVSAIFQTTKITEWLALSENAVAAFLAPWSFLTYAFLHTDLLHLAVNMMILYYFSKLFFTRFSSKLFLKIYVIGAFSGGVLYVLFYEMFPMLNTQDGYLLGASAAVMAIVVFISAMLPQMQVSVFSFKIKLWHIAVFLVAKDLLLLPSSAAVGHIAHLGGALLGYVYALQYKKGNDIGKWFEKLLNTIASWQLFSKKSPLKTVHKTKAKRRASDKTVFQKKRVKQEQVNAILDKISKSGYESLSKEEKAFLFQSGKE